MAKESSKKAPAVEAVAEKPAVKLTRPAPRTWDIGGLFWGLLLVTIGALLLLANFDYVELDWGNVLQIWPVAIIAAGVSILSVRSALWKVASTLLMIGTLVLIVLLATGTIGTSSEYRTFTSDSKPMISNAKQAEVTLKAGASKVEVRSANLEHAADATLKSNVTELRQQTSVSGDTEYLTLTGDSNRRWWFTGSFVNEWFVTLDNDRPMRLIIDAGASEIDADLSNALLHDLTLKAGASKSVITLGDKAQKTLVNIDSGASSVLIRVPKSSGVSVAIDGGLVSKNLGDLKQINEDYYETDGYITASKLIEIKADIGAANFTIERY